MLNAIEKIHTEKLLNRLLSANTVEGQKNAPWGDKTACDFVGWLQPPDAQEIAQWQDMAAQWMTSNIKTLILIGIGGSALGATLLASMPKKQTRPNLRVLDSLDHIIITQIMSTVDPNTCNIIIASKSGTTLEVNILQRIFTQWMQKKLGSRYVEHFTAITDLHSPLDCMARETGYAFVLHGKPNIGGRFSVFSAFGLFPAACTGIDIDMLVLKVSQAHQRYHTEKSLPLGARIGGHWWEEHQAGKSYLQCIGKRSSRHSRQYLFAAWLVQLVAESTGKGRYALLPFLTTQQQAIHDRCQCISLENVPESKSHLGFNLEDLPQAMVDAFYATTIYAALHGMNPFDQPDVEASKNALRNMLKEKPQPQKHKAINPITLSLEHLCTSIKNWQKENHPLSFIAILDFQTKVAREKKNWNTWKNELATLAKAPVLHFRGPSYLHATGQLFKGADIALEGCFIVLLPNIRDEALIPDEEYGLSQLCTWQALADIQVLRTRHRTVVVME